MSGDNQQRPVVLLVGAGHWSNPGLDYHSPNFDDMLAPGRQREIAVALDHLARFAPTKVAIESMPGADDELNADYRQFRAGRLALTANERHQIGFRLATMLDHDQIHGIDWHNLEQPIGWDDAIAVALAHGQRDLIATFASTNDHQEAGTNVAPSPIARKSVADLLIAASDPEALAIDHGVYVDLALVGGGHDYVGADVVLRWYERNMKIFVNLARLMTSPSDRVLVVIGAGHLPLLSHFIDGSQRFDRVPVNAYLA